MTSYLTLLYSKVPTAYFEQVFGDSFDPGGRRYCRTKPTRKGIHPVTESPTAEQAAHAAARSAHIEQRAAGARAAALKDSPISEAIESLATAKPGDVQKIAASQITILDEYYRTALNQAQRSFRSAQILSGIGIGFFISAAGILLLQQSRDLALVTVIGGATVEVVAALAFWLYGRTTTQLAHFYERLEQSQRFLLANSFCETLDDNTKQRSRADLITAMTSGITNATTNK